MSQRWRGAGLSCALQIHIECLNLYMHGAKKYTCVLTHVPVCAVCECLHVYQADFLSIRTPTIMGNIH